MNERIYIFIIDMTLLAYKNDRKGKKDTMDKGIYSNVNSCSWNLVLCIGIKTIHVLLELSSVTPTSSSE